MAKLQVPTYPEFKRALRAYEPSPFERFPASDRRFAREGVHSALKNARRLWMALAAAARHCPEPTAIVDLGAYPGTLLRLLGTLSPALEAARFGAGLKMPAEFSAFMKRDCGAEMFAVNLDPDHPRLARRGLPTTVPLADATTDLVFALEIVEHLVDSAHLLAESRRLLRPGGVLVVTTPNITRIGSVMKLLVGRTNLDRVYPPTRALEEPHLREYAMHELCAEVANAGLVVREARYFVNEGTAFTRRSARQRLVDLVKVPFGLVPHFRGSLLLVAGREDA